MPVQGTVRDRRRAETVQEIKDAALQQLADAGPGGISLRGVARSVGMTVQSLYHYFDSRDALLTALIVDAHLALAAAVSTAAEHTRGRPPAERLQAATAAYRRWALTHGPAFLLLFGTPVPGFVPPPEATAGAAWRLAGPFLETVFDGWTADQLAAVPLPAGAEAIADVPPGKAALPAGAMALFIELRGRMHGLVMLELLGLLHPLQAQGEALFTGAVQRMTEELAALRARSSGPQR